MTGQPISFWDASARVFNLELQNILQSVGKRKLIQTQLHSEQLENRLRDAASEWNCTRSILRKRTTSRVTRLLV